MARLIRPMRKALCFRTQLLFVLGQQPNPQPSSILGSRNYISDMRKSAFQDNILRLLRNEIRYEQQRSLPNPNHNHNHNQPIASFDSFTVDDRPGEQWIRLKRKFGEKEDIKVEATMFDGSIPTSNSGGAEDNVQLHITLVVNISKGDDGNILEIMCSAWPDAIVINKLFVRGRNMTLAHPYSGPEFRELDDELQKSLYEFLEERGINDELAIFLHEYMKNKDKSEIIRWLETVQSFIEKK